MSSFVIQPNTLVKTIVRISGSNIGWIILALFYVAAATLFLVEGSSWQSFGGAGLAVLIVLAPYGIVWLALSLILRKDWRQPLGVAILGVFTFVIFVSFTLGSVLRDL